jgi:chitin disaccharide deacetylase
VSAVILNADDYAMDEGVDAAILALAKRGTVTAASAMVLSPSWSDAGRRLLDVKVDRGLHLDLTSPFAAATPPALPRLMGAAFSGRLDRSKMRHAIERQLDAFEAVAKAPPDFIDGHQHVHQLPVVRDVLMIALKAQYGALASRIGIRLCLARRWRGLKAAIIAATGAGALSRLIRKWGHPANTDFAGVYDFSPSADLAALWRGWLTTLIGERPLIMCHIAANEGPNSPFDRIRTARISEWQWLCSQSFRDLCSECAIVFRGWQTGGNANAQ